MRTPVPIPRLGDKLRAKIIALATSSVSIADNVFATVRAREPSYASLSEEFQRDVRSHIELAIAYWFSTLLQGRTLDSADLERISAFGRGRARQGVSLSTLLTAYRAGCQELWQHIIHLGAEESDVRDDLLFEISPFFFEFFDLLSQRLVAGHLEEMAGQIRSGEALRGELARVIFNQPDDTAAFRKACEALGADPSVPRVALVLDVALPDVLPSMVQDNFEQLVLAVARQLKMPSNDLLCVMHRSHLVVWVPTIRGDSLLTTDRQLQLYAACVVRSVPDVSAVGVGLVGDGGSGWASSVDEAFKALSGRRGSGSRGPVYPYTDVAVSQSVRYSDSVFRYVSSLLERISVEPELFSTLCTYFDQGQHRKLAAAALGIHPNTLNYRLDRLETILGARLDDAGWISRLDVAIRLRRLSRVAEV